MPSIQAIKNWIRSNPGKATGFGLGGAAGLGAVGYGASKAPELVRSAGEKIQSGITQVKDTAQKTLEQAKELGSAVVDKAKSFAGAAVDPFGKSMQKNWHLDPSIANAIAGAGIGTALGAGGGALMGLISPDKKKGRLKSMLSNMLYGGGLGAVGGGAVGGLGTEAVRLGLPHLGNVIPGLGGLAAYGYNKLDRNDQFGLMGGLLGSTPVGNVVSNPATNWVQQQAGNVKGLLGKTASNSTEPLPLKNLLPNPTVGGSPSGQIYWGRVGRLAGSAIPLGALAGLAYGAGTGGVEGAVRGGGQGLVRGAGIGGGGLAGALLGQLIANKLDKGQHGPGMAIGAGLGALGGGLLTNSLFSKSNKIRKGQQDKELAEVEDAE